MRVLIVDDELEMGRLLVDGLRAKEYDASHCASADEAFSLVMEGKADLVATDLRMRGMNGIELCQRVAANRPDVPVVVMTGFGTLDTAIETIRAGAFDFLTKPFGIDALVLVVERAISQRDLREEVKRLRLATHAHAPLDGLLGESAPMRAVTELVNRIAESDSTTLVTGETGTGKELVARAIHNRSVRRAGPFIAINCGAMPAALLESELFGHVKGAFTDARDNRTGLFVEANGGTLLLDEVGEMPLSMQVKLLRSLETRTARIV
ncbi:MAG TPA: sigma-54 dependent transcriptional regulator, partial [Polyangiaceae bacterium]